MTTALPDLILEPLVRAASMEDLGTMAMSRPAAIPPIPPGCAPAPRGRFCMQIARLAFHLVDPTLEVRTRKEDGSIKATR